MTGSNFLGGWMARNPLGIIAAFISLIYGISALLLGSTVSKLSVGNQTVLVWFVVLFPVLVLAVFGWLVRNHHRKLYAPLDFRSDGGFLTAGGNISPSAVGERIRAELEDEHSEPPTDLPAASADQSADRSISKSDLDVGESHSSTVKPEREEPSASSGASSFRVEQAYLAENLVLQELESEWRAPLRRNVTFYASAPDRVLRADALFKTDDGPVIVDVKFVSSLKNVNRRIRDAQQQIQKLQKKFDGHPSMRFLVAIVISGAENQYDDLVDSLSGTAASFDNSAMIRFYSLEKLRGKYGI
tara:strand:+ start:3324 stop:4226 length:903 start_codon:yes stop_codon:yes gene_type:complete